MPARTLSRNDSQLITGRTFPERLKGTLDAIFSQVQDNVQNHQKNQVALYKLHFEAQGTAKLCEGTKKPQTGEDFFRDVFIERLSYILDYPRKPLYNKVDRLVQFIGSYVKYMNEKGAWLDTEDAEADGDDDTFASRFIAAFIRYILQGYKATNKAVRVRVVQITSHVISHLGQIELDLYNDLKTALKDRMQDKDASVRALAVTSLCKIVDTATEDEDYDTEVEELLLDALASDPAAEVRRAVLVNLPLDERRLEFILPRLREQDAIARRLMYTKILALDSKPDEELPPAHPSKLRPEQITEIVKAGLEDRDETVRAAAAHLMASWYDEMAQLVTFLSLFDLEIGGGELAKRAVEAVFKARPETVGNLQFDTRTSEEDFTPESALLMRIFVDYCKVHDSSRIDAVMPEIQTLATVVQKTFNTLIEDIDNEEREVFIEGLGTAKYSKMLIIDQVLHTITLMPIDHYGGRITSALMRRMLEHPLLPSELIPRCLDVLREVIQNERDLIMMVVEIMDELRDPAAKRAADAEDGEAQDPDQSQDIDSPEATPIGKRPYNEMFKKPVAELTDDEREQVDEIDLKCLTLLQCVLERVEEPLENNAMLMGPTANVVQPAIQRDELEFKEKGLTCLGLLCTISLVKVVVEIFFQLMVDSDDDKLLAVAAHGLAKLVLAGMVSAARTDGCDEDPKGEDDTNERSMLELVLFCCRILLNPFPSQTIRNLIIAYTHPDNLSNQPLIQCLHHALSVFAHTAAMNKDIMRSVCVLLYIRESVSLHASHLQSFRPLYEQLCAVYREQRDEGALEPSRVIAMFLEWTDPELECAARPGEGRAEDVVEGRVGQCVGFFHWQDERKPLCSMLPALRLPDGEDVDALKVQKVKLLTETLLKGRHPPPGKGPRDLVEKFDKQFEKRYTSQLEGFSREEARERDEFKALFDFVDNMLASDGEEDLKPSTRGSSR
ncbi:armadillo-type protein [Schizophyllum commune]